ncbi:MAG: tryptophan 7-halogenase, partial [Acinetobacter sp.]
QHRTPRLIDFSQYDQNGLQMFGVPSWFAVGAGVGVIHPEATTAELYALSPEKKQRLAKYLQQTKQRLFL